jgi:hypothetical protein
MGRIYGLPRIQIRAIHKRVSFEKIWRRTDPNARERSWSCGMTQVRDGSLQRGGDLAATAMEGAGFADAHFTKEWHGDPFAFGQTAACLRGRQARAVPFLDFIPTRSEFAHVPALCHSRADTGSPQRKDHLLFRSYLFPFPPHPGTRLSGRAIKSVSPPSGRHTTRPSR